MVVFSRSLGMKGSNIAKTYYTKQENLNSGFVLATRLFSELVHQNKKVIYFFHRTVLIQWKVIAAYKSPETKLK